jgi:hypothetical protein
VGGLGHYIEAEGIATTQISLIREHTEIIKPPRALWVSFPLGRPLGNPNDAGFQNDVLRHALRLLERDNGPVLEDFPKDAKEDETEQLPMACPVNFAKPAPEQNSMDELFQKFRQELNLMQTWHTLACERNKRSTAGVSTLSPDEIGELFCSFVKGEVEEKQLNGQKLSDMLRMAAEDLRACYLEGIAVQPGQSTGAATLNDWFWGETHAALIINEARKKCLQLSEKDMLLAGKLLLVPRNQLHRFEGSSSPV